MSRNVAAISFYGLLSLFPLLHLYRFVLDVAREVSPRVAESMDDVISEDLGVLGGADLTLLEADPVTGGGVLQAALAIVLALWGATRAFAVLFSANDDAWEVSPSDRYGGPARRAVALVGIVVFAVRLALIGLGGAVAAFVGGGAGWTFYVAVEFAANLWIVYGLMCIGSTRPRWQAVRAAVFVAAVGFAALQLWGAALARQWSSGASGAHAATVGLLAVMWGHVLVLQVATAVAASRGTPPVSHPT